MLRWEIPNAFELLLGRGLITRAECRAIHEQLRDDLEKPTADASRVGSWSAGWSVPANFSPFYTAKFLGRSLGLLHVAAALAALCTTFVSADDRQLFGDVDVAQMGAHAVAIVTTKNAMLGVAHLLCEKAQDQ